MDAMNGASRSRHETSKPRSLLVRLRTASLFGEHGGALVETAVTMPVVLIIMTGIFSLGAVLYQKLALAQAVGSGGRYLTVARGNADPCAATAAKIYAAAPTLSQSKMTLSFNINGTAYPGASCTAGAANMIAGQTATVTATYPCSFAPIYGMNLGACSLSESTTQVIQ